MGVSTFQIRRISPIIKPIAAKCNLSCSYCYYKNTHTSDEYGNEMGFAVLARIIKDTISIAKHFDQKAEFTWHGGEPTLIGIDFFKQVVNLQKAEIDGTEICVKNNIQSNAILINENWASFSKENNFTFGISIDGPKWLHDTHRQFASGLGSFDNVMKGINFLQTNNIKFAAIAVITEASFNHSEEIIDFFIDNGIFQFDLIPCAELPGSPNRGYTISPDHYAKFMIDAFEHWLSYNNPDIQIRFLRQVVRGLLKAEPGLCSMGINYCGIFPTITPNGDVFFCDNYEGSEDMLVGNITSTPLQEIIFGHNSRHQQIRNSISFSKNQCLNCEWKNVCGGGCPRHNRKGVNYEFSQNNYFCNSYKQIISYISPRINNILSVKQ
ncbi:MAG: SPASM domain-containing protein [Pelolinea sp.]|nr:SPASM domain-containing protein [Pelolinea sp.]